MELWREAAQPGHTYDPCEVTVQLDKTGQHLDETFSQGEAAENSDGPVFVDESGRRSRRYRRIGIAVGVLCGSYAVIIVVTLLSGNSSAPWLPSLGPEAGRPAGQVDTPSLPVDPAGPSASPGGAPDAGPSGTDGTDGTDSSPRAGGSPDASASTDVTSSASPTADPAKPGPTGPGATAPPERTPPPVDPPVVNPPGPPDPDPVEEPDDTETTPEEPPDPPTGGQPGAGVEAAAP